jgi:predicted Zn-dependent protease with MMP-like domain
MTSSSDQAEKLSPQEFQALVEQAVAELPKMFQERLENISIAVLDYPSDEVLQSLNPRPSRHSLLGVYIGLPYTRRPGYPLSGMMPDRIELYRRNLEAICPTRQELVRQVRKTIVHEIGHYFGLDEDTLKDLEGR